MKNTKKTANKLPVPGKIRKGFRFYCAAVLSVALVLGCSVTAFAANGASCRWDFRSSPTTPANAATAFSPSQAALSSLLPKRF